MWRQKTSEAMGRTDAERGGINTLTAMRGRMHNVASERTSEAMGRADSERDSKAWRRRLHHQRRRLHHQRRRLHHQRRGLHQRCRLHQRRRLYADSFTGAGSIDYGLGFIKADYLNNGGGSIYSGIGFIVSGNVSGSFINDGSGSTSTVQASSIALAQAKILFYTWRTCPELCTANH